MVYEAYGLNDESDAQRCNLTYVPPTCVQLSDRGMAQLTASVNANRGVAQLRQSTPVSVKPAAPSPVSETRPRRAVSEPSETRRSAPAPSLHYTAVAVRRRRPGTRGPAVTWHHLATRLPPPPASLCTVSVLVTLLTRRRPCRHRRRHSGRPPCPSGTAPCRLRPARCTWPSHHPPSRSTFCPTPWPHRPPSSWG